MPEILSSRKTKKGVNASTIIADDNTITDPIGIAKSFSNFFISIGTNLQNKMPITKNMFTDHLRKTNSENFIVVLPATADKIIDLPYNLKLKSSKIIGPYSIPIKIMKISKETISLLLSQLINNSISKGIFPNICKLGQVIPIFKSNSRLLCNNYNPISLLLHISKIFENVIHRRLNFFST